MNTKDEDSRLYSSAGFASKMPSRAERKRARASTGRTKSSKNSAYNVWAADVSTTPVEVMSDNDTQTEMLECRDAMPVNNLRDAIPAPRFIGQRGRAKRDTKRPK